MTAVAGCVFCEVVAGTREAHVVAADEGAVALLDVAPAAPGHTLVVPRAHHVDLFDAGPDVAADVARTVQQVAVLLRDRLGADGLTVRQNNGAASGQVVGHLHVHLVPRWDGDGHVGWPEPRDDAPEPAEVLRRLQG